MLAPYFFVVGLVAAALAGWLASRAFKRRRSEVFGAVMLFYVVVFWFVFGGPFVGVEKKMTFAMNWKIIEPKRSADSQSEVVLTFLDYPGRTVGIFSDEVADYLRRADVQPIDVSFSVTLDWGQTRAFHATRIGTLEGWTASSSYSSAADRYPGPFP